MKLNKLKSITKNVAGLLEADNWTVDQLSTSSITALTQYEGIGKKTAEKIIAESAKILNERGLEESEILAWENFLRKASPASITKKLIEDDENVTIESLALSTIGDLAQYSIDEGLAAKIISYAQDEVNRQGLYDSGVVSAATKSSNPAFPDEWLSGEVPPPPMGVRVKRAFDAAVKDYKWRNE